MGYTFENDTNEKGAAVACGKAGNTIEGRCDEHDDIDTGRYALRLMIDIARQGEAGALVTMRQAAEREDLSVEYLEQLGGALVKAGVLKSVRGVSGGYLLARPADQITAGDVLRATEGSCAPVSCLEDGAEACPRRDQCVAINFWRGLDQAIEDYVDNVTLADLVQMG